MSNRSYLTTTNTGKIYPGFQNPAFNSEQDWILISGGCIPLLWLALFSDSDLTTREFVLQGKPYSATAPITERLLAINRLNERGVFLNQLFGASGSLEHHLSLFGDYLASCSGKFLTLECEEIACEYSAGQFDMWLRQCLLGLRLLDPGVRENLIRLSTVMSDRRFLTLAELTSRKAPKEDWWNYYRIMGDAYLRPVPWG